MRYAFIDGNHLLSKFKETVKQTHPDADLDGNRIRSELDASKVFFFHGLPPEADNLFSTTRELHSRLDGAYAFHVREGTTKKDGEGRNREKQVDILLAIEAMNHAVRRNCSHMVLVASDSDYVPLVRTLGDYGMFVEILACPKRLDGELRRYSDSYKELNYHVCWRLSNLAEEQPVVTRLVSKDSSRDWAPLPLRVQIDNKACSIEATQSGRYRIFIDHLGQGYQSKEKDALIHFLKTVCKATIR